MKIEVGKFYKTRDGRKVRIYATDGAPPYPIHGASLSEDGEWLRIGWTAQGAFYSDTEAFSEDIVSEWKEPVKVSGWVNVYKDGYMSPIIESREAARTFPAGPDRIACVYVSGEEGKEP